jgi:hypothetical protein
VTPKELSILILQGDAEARLLAEAPSFLQVALPHQSVRWVSAWTPRADHFSPDSAPPPEALVHCGAISEPDVGELLAPPHALVILALFPSVAVPCLRHRSGGAFLAHRGLREAWSPEVAARVDAECMPVDPLTAADAAACLEPVIERLQAAGSAVALCTSFRRVAAPLAHRREPGPPSLRDQVRSANLETYRLSHRTGCFVLDLDRPLAQAGGGALQADCFGGDGRAAEIALDELLGLVFDALPEAAMPAEET